MTEPSTIELISHEIRLKWATAMESFLGELGVTLEHGADYMIVHQQFSVLNGRVVRKSDGAMLGKFSTEMARRDDGTIDVVVHTHRCVDYMEGGNDN